MTQTTRLASFGPDFIMAALSTAHFVNKIYKTLVSIRKHEKKKEKSSPRA
jgi:hypothetical protein